MITFYKEYMIQYNERPMRDSYSKQNEHPKQIVVTSIVANGNFHCMYGERIRYCCRRYSSKIVRRISTFLPIL